VPERVARVAPRGFAVLAQAYGSVLLGDIRDIFDGRGRLTLTSPVRGSGKTTLLDLMEALCGRPLKSDSITASSIYHAVDREHQTHVRPAPGMQIAAAGGHGHRLTRTSRAFSSVSAPKIASGAEKDSM